MIATKRQNCALRNGQRSHAEGRRAQARLVTEAEFERSRSKKMVKPYVQAMPKSWLVRACKRDSVCIGEATALFLSWSAFFICIAGLVRIRGNP